MWAPTAFLLLCGLSLGPVHGGQYFDPRPRLWAEPELLQDPGANLTLVCLFHPTTKHFVLYRNGVVQASVQLDKPSLQHRFHLGTVTEETRGFYRCGSGEDFGDTWETKEPSELLEVTMPGSLPTPLLTSIVQSWVGSGTSARLRCISGLHGVKYKLQQEGGEAQQKEGDPGDVAATFFVSNAGNYSCTYLTHEGAEPSPASTILEVPYLAALPPPEMEFEGQRLAVVPLGKHVELFCMLPLIWSKSQLLYQGKVLSVRSSSTSSDTTFEVGTMAGSGVYTCRYLRGPKDGKDWSRESNPVELLRSDGSLPAPELTADLKERPVRIRCKAPQSGFRFALLHDGRVVSMQSPEGPEAVFELSRLSAAEAGSYSCVYAELRPPFLGSQPCPPLLLLGADPLPRPHLHAPSAVVIPGHHARLRCESGVPGVKVQLLREGEEKPVAEAWARDSAADLLLHNVGPQHAGKYSCRYHVRKTVSELSEPVLLSVAGS